MKKPQSNPYIGGRENILSDNLYMSEILFAAVEACDRDFPGEDITQMGEELMVGRLRSLNGRINTDRLLNSPLTQKAVGCVSVSDGPRHG